LPPGLGPRRDRRTRVDANDVGADLKQVLITQEQLHQRIGELAAAKSCLSECSRGPSW
jgi:hypothetical protein